MFHILPQRLRAVLPRLPSRTGSDEQSVAGSDEEKAQPCAYATRSRRDFRRPLRWTVSLSELNLAAELFSALTHQCLEQSWIHDGFLSCKRNASDTTFRSRHATRRDSTGVGARVHTRGVAKRLEQNGAAERVQQAASLRAPASINIKNSFIRAPPSGS
jgi:hypothetical protein